MSEPLFGDPQKNIEREAKLKATMDEMKQSPFGCIKNTIRLRSGRYFDFENPAADQFTLADIGGALSKICRFGGQIARFYSVAEHLTCCMIQAERDGLTLDEMKSVFLHDAHEAFIGDIVKPLKIMFPDSLEALTEKIDRVIEQKFGVDFRVHHAAIKKIDKEMLIAERRALFSADKVLWHGENEARTIHPDIVGMLPDVAEIYFKNAATNVFCLPYNE